MVVPRNFKKGPLSPMGRATCLFCKKKFTNRSTVSAARGLEGVAPLGDKVPPLYKPSTPIPFSFEPKNSIKNPEKKRGVRTREAAKPCRIAHL